MNEMKGDTGKETRRGGAENFDTREKAGAVDDATVIRKTGESGRFPKIYTARDIARILQFDIGTIYRMHRNGLLPDPLPFSKSLRWNGWHFDRWVDDGCPPPRQDAGTARGKTAGKDGTTGTAVSGKRSERKQGRKK